MISVPQTAMVFAAGLGSRMRPLTEKAPKPLIKVAGKALLDHTLDRLAEAGVGKAVVNVHWLGHQIIEHLVSRMEPRIIISDESAKLLDQGGGIRKALGHLDSDPFWICNTDAFWTEGAGSNLRRMAQAWNPEAMDGLLLLAPVTTSIGVDWRGDFDMEADGALKKRAEQAVSPFVYTGVGLLKKSLFENEAREAFALAPLLFAAAERGRLFGLRIDGQWMHVGTPEAIAEAEDAVLRSVL